jgi:hypothetical protein
VIDQLVAEATTYTTYTKHYRQTSVSSAKFELEIPAIKWSQKYALGRRATEIGG